jgi:hypothetical protein
MLSPILPVQLLQQFNICPSSVLHICRTRQTSPQVIFTSSDHSEVIGGKSFRTDKKVQRAVDEWLHSQPKDFFSRSIHAFPKHWNTCMECNGDYVEKLCHCITYVYNNYEIKNIQGFHLTHPRTTHRKNRYIIPLTNKRCTSTN